MQVQKQQTANMNSEAMVLQVATQTKKSSVYMGHSQIWHLK